MVITWSLVVSAVCFVVGVMCFLFISTVAFRNGRVYAYDEDGELTFPVKYGKPKFVGCVLVLGLCICGLVGGLVILMLEISIPVRDIEKLG